MSATAVLLSLALAACDVFSGGDQDQSNQAGQGQQQRQAEGGDAEASEDAEAATAGGRVGGGEPIASSESGGLVLEIYELRRTGNSMTLIFGVSAEEDDVRLQPSHLAEGNSEYAATGVALVDTVNHQRYRVLEDADGNCVCSTGYGGRLDAGERVKLSAAFPAAPDDVDRLSVHTPKFPQIDDVPISDG